MTTNRSTLRATLPVTLPFMLRCFALCLFTLTFACLAHAQAPQRAFVSATSGNDANASAPTFCSRQQPCRNFNAAVGVVAYGGEVVALDSGGYGAVTINKAVQITAPTGVYVAITAVTGDAITVNAGASDTVVLRGLTLNGLGAQNGINWNTGVALHVESCIINGFSSAGILFDDDGELFVKDTIIRNGGVGINIFADVAATASIDRCRVENNSSAGIASNLRSHMSVSHTVVAGNGGEGIFSQGNAATMAVSHSVASGNGSSGFSAFTGGQMTIESCIATGNAGSGMFVAGPGAVIRVSNSVATGNATGFSQSSSAVFESLGNNVARGNTTNKSGTITVVTPD